MATQRFVTTLLVAVCSAGSRCEAEVGDAERVLRGMIEARSQLKSGVYRITGEHRIESGQQIERYPLTINGAFDHERGLSNFQRTERIPWIEDGEQVEGGVEVGLRLIRRPECMYLYCSGIGPEALTIHTPDLEVESPVNSFDIRVFGLTTFVNGEEAMDLDSIAEAFPSKGIVKCTKTDDIWEIQWKVPTNGPTILCTLWVDEAKQFAPIKLSYRMEPKGTDGAEMEWGQDAVVTWKKISDVWVPASARMHQRNSARTNTYDLEVEWKKVNDDIEDERFDMKGMQLPNHTLVSDHRTGKPFVIGTFEELP